MSAHPLLVAKALSWQTPAGDPVLRGIDLSVHREKTGLVGANGSGKTTLLRLLTGSLAPSAGTVRRAGTFAFLPQDPAPLLGHTVAEVLGVREQLAALARLSAGQGSEADLHLLEEDWTIEERVEAELSRVGLARLELHRPVASLSGGETTRLVLASLFMRQPDLLILDEPTNNLDVASREALYTALRDWNGALLVVSHDRTLLRLLDRILELTSTGVRVYGGNYDVYVAQRDAETAAARQQLDEAARELRRVRRDAQAARERQHRRNRRGQKERDQGGMPKIVLNAQRDRSQQTSARLEGVHADRASSAADALAAARQRVEEQRELKAMLPPVDLPAGKLVLDLQEVTFTYPGASRPLIERFRLRLIGPERVALVGPNGCGKSTLLRLIQHDLTPDTGSVRVGVERVRYLDQSARLLDPARSVLDNFRLHHPGLSESACRLLLARFLFRTDAVHTPAAGLSGGERLRAALACVLSAAAPPALLLLDEPTNHLDLSSLASLEVALRQYTGALLVISHDRDFLEAIGVTRVIDLASPSN